MAKQRDDRERPDSNDPKSRKPGKGPQKPPKDDLEDVPNLSLEADDAVEIVDDDLFAQEIALGSSRTGSKKPPPLPDEVEVLDAEVISDRGKKPSSPVDDDIFEAEVLSDSGSKKTSPGKPVAPPTMVGKVSQPTKMARAPQPTQLARKSTIPTMLGDDADAEPPSAKGKVAPPPSSTNADDEEIVEAEAISGPGKKAAEPVDLADDAVLDAEVVSDRGQKAPAAAEFHDDDVFDAEEVLDAAEVVSDRGQKAPAPADFHDDDVMDAEEVLDAAEVVSDRGQKAPAPMDAFDEEVLEAAEVASNRGRKSPAPSDAFDEEVLEAAEVVSDRGKKAPQPADALDDDFLEAAEVLSDRGQKKAPPSEPSDEEIFGAEEIIEAAEPSSRRPFGMSGIALGNEQTLADDADFDLDRGKSKPASDLDQTAAFGADEFSDRTEQISADALLDDDEGSAVNLGKSPKKSDRPSGVDQLAEALESGVDLDSKEGPESSAPTRKIAPPPPEDEIDFSAIPDATMDLGATPPPKSRKKMAEEATEEIAEEFIDDEATQAFVDDEKPGKKKPKSARDLVTEEFVPDEDDLAAAKKKRKARTADDEITEEEEAPVSRKRGGAAVATRKPPKPKYGRRWIGGILFGWILLAGAAAGIWYFAPDLIDEGLAQIPPSPTATDPKASVIGNLEELKRASADLPKEREKLTEAQNSIKKQAEALTAAKEAEEKLRKDLDSLKESEKVGLEVRDLLKKEDLADVPKALKELMKEKAAVDKLKLELTKTLVDSKLLDESDELTPEAFQKTIKDFSGSKAALDSINKKLADAGFKEVDKLVSEKRKIDDKLKLVNKHLLAAKVEATDEKGVLELIKERSAIEAERAKLDEAIATAYKELKTANLAPEGNPREVLVDAIKAVRKKAESPLALPLSHLAAAMSGLGNGTGKLIERSFDTTAMLAELGFYRLREPFVQTPGKQLDTWSTLLKEPKFNDPKKLAGVEKEAKYVLSEAAKASPEEKAKAHFVIGLAKRNQEKFEQARENLEKSVAEIKSLKTQPEWARQAEQSLRELTDSKAHFLPLVSVLQQKNDREAALKALNTGLKAIPDDGLLLARRAMVHLEMNRSLGKKIPADVQKSIRADIDAARKDKAAAAEAYFTLGQLEEALEQWAKAEDDYRLAIKHHIGAPEEASRYRIALARLLLLHNRPPTLPVSEPEEKGKDVGSLPAPGIEAASPAVALLTLSLVGLQEQADDDEKKDKKDAKKEDPDPKKKKKADAKEDKDDDDAKKDKDVKKKDEPKEKKDDPDAKKDKDVKKKDEPKEKKDDPDAKKDKDVKKKDEPKEKKDDPDAKDKDVKKKDEPKDKKDEPDAKKDKDLKKKDEPKEKKDEPDAKKDKDVKKKDEPKEKKKEPEAKEEPKTPVPPDGVAPKKSDDEETPESIARLKESIELAKELIKSADPKIKGQGHMILGQAYAKQGQRTRGLEEYVKGLQLLFPGTPGLDLDKMVKEHPAFQQPDTLARPNPFLAERQFGEGLHFYWSKQYPQAEEHFKAAVGFFDQDARYYYFLGLARLHQKGQLKRDAAYFAFEQGARLETGNHPPATDVNVSLERIQGDLRRFVNGFRQKALLTAK